MSSHCWLNMNFSPHSVILMRTHSHTGFSTLAAVVVRSHCSRRNNWFLSFLYDQTQVGLCNPPGLNYDSGRSLDSDTGFLPTIQSGPCTIYPLMWTCKNVADFADFNTSMLRILENWGIANRTWILLTRPEVTADFCFSATVGAIKNVNIKGETRPLSGVFCCIVEWLKLRVEWN